MYTLPAGSLAATGLGTAHLLVAAWVLIIAGVALYQIVRRPKKR